MSIPQAWIDPPRIFSVMPFWFWNDDLDEREIIRQIEDMEAHGVYGFVIHPRVGLPRELGWMSERLLHFYHVAIEEARRRGMYVILYDEGMYPSGSSSGQVVASNPDFQCRCLAKLDLGAGQEPALKPDENLMAIVQRKNGERMAVIDRKVNSVIRGLHYADESSGGKEPAEDEPPAGDILNPDSVAEFIRLVYDKFAAHFSQYFGNTIPAIFTDEPGPLGRCRERGVLPGTRGILPEVNRLLGYDMTPHLPALWYDDEPDAPRFRADYERAIALRLEETYYAQLNAWCEVHGVALTGHPARGDHIGPLRFLEVPGQDLVWRWVLPDQPSALQGPEATQAKCSSSAMLHDGRQRNSNECCGAYGHELSWDEMTWLAHWCFVRGVNWLYPHAFYYSVRGPRWDERPPDVGPHSPWWDRYKQYADACRRLSWLNSDCGVVYNGVVHNAHVCHIAILGQPHWLPWRSARVCLEHQRDFNYLEERHLWQDAQVDQDGIHIRGMHYQALIVEEVADPRARPALDKLEQAGRVIRFGQGTTEAELLGRLDALVPQEVHIAPASPGLRVRHIVKDGQHCFMLFNETHPAVEIRVELPVRGPASVFDPWTGESSALPSDHRLALAGHSFLVVVVSDE